LERAVPGGLDDESLSLSIDPERLASELRAHPIVDERRQPAVEPAEPRSEQLPGGT